MGAEDDDVAAVRRVMERYVDTTFRADLEGLKGTFHPAASMAGYLGSELIVGTPEPFFADIASHPSMAESNAPFKAEISAIHVSGRAASATVEESGFFGTMSFVDYFHLLRVDGAWTIVHKTFTSL